jgi:periplasmic protein TonB
MDLEKGLIASKKQPRRKGSWFSSAASLLLHGVLITAFVLLGAHAADRADAEDKPIKAFITQGAPPPPPPPPPPPAASNSAPKTTPRVQPTPVRIPQNAFIPPTETPKELPKVEPIPTTSAPIESLPTDQPMTSGSVEPDTTAGVAGGVVGGVAGGTVGGELGGEIGGVKGGEIGGVVGGTVGGTGTGTEGNGTGGVEAPPSGPMRVGGDVKAPVPTTRVDPVYTEAARKARLNGIVVVEAVIDRNGNVDQARVVKGLPLGLGESAVAAVRQWKFKPGTLNGQPVDVIFNLTVNFKVEN